MANVVKEKIKPYFGMNRTMYLQTLCQKWGDFLVSWNFQRSDGEIGFTKRRSVMELWSEEYEHPSKCRLEKVQHRQAMPIEKFVEIDDVNWFVANKKKNRALRLCEVLCLEYAIYKSRKGFHISVLDPQNQLNKKVFIELVGCDGMMISNNCTWSMEWTNHWKQLNFVILPIDISKGYEKLLLGE
jgi:hypothetical protein